MCNSFLQVYQICNTSDPDCISNIVLNSGWK